jgi:hypothetical protein
MPADTPTIVFVHGAWADATGSCWAPRTEPFRRRATIHGRAGNARIEEVAASHASMVSQPEAVTQLILSAVEETSRSRA